MIEGVLLTPLRQLHADSGSVFHMMKAGEAGFAGFGEVYFSTVRSGAVKAWKRHNEMTLNLACLSGRIRFVCYDDRPGSPTCGAFQEVTLSPDENYQRLTVPPGVWTGFEGVAAVESMLCNCASLPHDPAESDRLPADDPVIPFSWAR